MGAVTESSALAGRSSSQQPRSNANNTSAALQGATMAFNSYSPKAQLSTSAQNSSGAMKAATAADRARRPTPSPNDPSTETPNNGFVMDKIKKFSETSAPTNTHQGENDSMGRHGSRVETPQILAAAKAAERSANRTPQNSSPARPTSPLKNVVDRRYPQDHFGQKGARDPPLPDRRLQHLAAPIPIRKISLGNNLDDGSDVWNSRRLITPSATDTLSVDESSTARSTSPAKSIARERSRESRLAPINRAPSHHESVISQKSPKPSLTGNQASKAVPPPSRARRSPSPSNQKKPKLPPRMTAPRSNGVTQASPTSLRDDLDEPRRINRSNSISTFSSYPPSTADLTSTSTRSRASIYDNGDVEEGPGMSKESLANAIIASSLASSRAPSPMKVPPPLPPHRRSRSRSLLHPGNILKGETRQTPSPPKGLRQTLRDHSKSDEENETKYGRRHLIRHHPHKHHEGGRKRWRQEITERERKRYEGVWAANKGLWIPSDAPVNRALPEEQDPSWRALAPSEMVVNLVVRDIWFRSRLPAHTLEQIWNLVARNGIGMLSREEFVVGMWLIDQQLKGNKLPVKVPDSVWESVRHVAGIKLPLEL